MRSLIFAFWLTVVSVSDICEALEFGTCEVPELTVCELTELIICEVPEFGSCEVSELVREISFLVTLVTLSSNLILLSSIFSIFVILKPSISMFNFNISIWSVINLISLSPTSFLLPNLVNYLRNASFLRPRLLGVRLLDSAVRRGRISRWSDVFG